MSDLVERLRNPRMTVHGRAGMATEAADEIERLTARVAETRTVVEEQANDEGLWFRAATAPEAYLQQELRRLHAAIEGVSPEESARAALEDKDHG